MGTILPFICKRIGQEFTELYKQCQDSAGNFCPNKGDRSDDSLFPSLVPDVVPS